LGEDQTIPDAAQGEGVELQAAILVTHIVLGGNAELFIAADRA
jgi:hypothetical protein